MPSVPTLWQLAWRVSGFKNSCSMRFCAFDSDSEMKAGKSKEKEWSDAHSSGSSHWRVVPFKWCFRQIGTSLMKQSFDERNQQNSNILLLFC